jgi:ceramide glucosyltransferase
MTWLLLLAVIYLAQLGLKAALAWSVRAREPVPAPASLQRVTVIQPVMSGDETLAAILGAGLAELPECPVIWIADEVDAEARQLCESLQAAHPGRAIRIITTPEPASGFNPKTWKLVAALPHVGTELLAVIDDDTRAPRRSVEALVAALDAGADIATGLPSYVPGRGAWSLLVAEFVNSAAILTYLSAAACIEPLSINGMCYALRTADAREHDLFQSSGRAITDDLAVAKAIRHRQGRIVQTSRPQHITTSITSFSHYRRLMHRWFVFSRILVQHESVAQRALVVFSFGLHPLVLAGLVAGAIAVPGGVWPLAAVLLVRGATLAVLNRHFTGSWRHSPLASIAAELLQPVFLAGAFLSPVIWWRRRKIRVRAFDDFEYLAS